MQRTRFLAQLKYEAQEIRKDFRTARYYRMWLTMIIGLTMVSIALNGILIPHHFFSGGTSGVALFYYYLVGWPSVAILYLILNIPLFIIGWREYALRYVFISIVGVFMFSGLLKLTTGINLPISDPLMAAVLAGVMIGAGSGFYLREGGSAGGMDILAKYIRKRWGIPMGTTMNIVNSFNMIGAWLIFDLKTAFFSGIYLFVMTWVLEKVQAGMSQHRALFIHTSKPDLVSGRIRQELKRGTTLIPAIGGYSHKPMQLVFSVINLYELGRIKQLMFEIDPQSFVTVTEASEVIGHHFRTFEEDGFRPPFQFQMTGHQKDTQTFAPENVVTERPLE